MITIDEMQDILEEIAEEVPEVFYKELNGGICLLPDRILAPESVEDDYFVLGEYISDELGCRIHIYYGSFAGVYADYNKNSPEDRAELVEELRETLFHEFTHHIENLAGERGLEYKDLEEIKEYLASVLA